MDRRKFMSEGLAAAAVTAAAGRARAVTDQPNVLMIMCDQMRTPRWFPKEARLPNFERLQERGLDFRRHYTCAVPCSPSRACLITGRHMDQNNVRMNVRKKRPFLDPAIPTLGHLFRAAGYRTPWFGKWHLSESPGQGDRLKSYGFSFHHVRAVDSFGLGAGLMNDPPVAKAAAAFIKEQVTVGKPFFMTVSLVNPHDICAYPTKEVPAFMVPKVIRELPPNWDDDLEGKPEAQREFQRKYDRVVGPVRARDKRAWLDMLNYYYFLTLQMDRQLGRVLDALEQSGQAKSTLVIFTSDHGEMGGSHRLRTKGPFVYQENTNVPLVMSWPGVIKKGIVTDALAQNVDIYPTLAGLIGADARGLPGRNLAPLFRNPEAQVSDHVLFSYEGSTVMERRLKPGQQAFSRPHIIRALRADEGVFAHYTSPQGPDEDFELYDSRKDQLEMKNVARDPAFAELRANLEKRLARARIEEMGPIG